MQVLSNIKNDASRKQTNALEQIQRDLGSSSARGCSRLTRQDKEWYYWVPADEL